MDIIDKSVIRQQLEKSQLMASTFFTVRSYVDICSNALLFALNDLYIPDSEPSAYMDLDGGGGELLRYYISLQLKDEYHYGSHNMVVNTCLPADNWRGEERGGGVGDPRFVLTDESVGLDQEAVNKILNKEWSILCEKGHGSYHFIYHNNLDIFDLTTILSRILGCKPVIRPYKYLLLKDGNVEYIHYDTLKKSFHTELEIMLRGMRVLE